MATIDVTKDNFESIVTGNDIVLPDMPRSLPTASTRRALRVRQRPSGISATSTAGCGLPIRFLNTRNRGRS